MTNPKNSLFGDLLRGHTDTILLSILSRGDSYGYRINRILEEETEHRFFLNEATLYTTFKRLENDGLIASYWKEETLAPPRKYYAITSKGSETLNRNVAEWHEAEKVIKHFIG